MSKIAFKTACKKMSADLYTPVGIYLRMRDRFRDTILLESTDSHAGENSRSVIGINAIAGIEITDLNSGEYKYPGQKTEKLNLDKKTVLADLLNDFMESFDAYNPSQKNALIAQGVFGYMSYDAVQFFENIVLRKNDETAISNIPLMRYRIYQYVIIIDHFRDELYLCENQFAGLESKLNDVESILQSRDVPQFSFSLKGKEISNISDEDYRAGVEKGIVCCKRGDVFQVVLSRSFQQEFRGDEFNVYRFLRSVTPGPYLFYFDYGDYKLMGSSPESQVVIQNGKAIVHPIAGTVRRTGDDAEDERLALALENDKKENAEHIMLVDLARNDLSRVCTNVKVTNFKKINYYSHVIHMVSEVAGTTEPNANPFEIIGAVFPAGTLSGAPKYRAMQLIEEFENEPRSFYGGTIGYFGLDKSCNHAIMIRSMLSRNNTLLYRAGAGVTVASIPQNELEEVGHKLGALKKAVLLAEGNSQAEREENRQ